MKLTKFEHSCLVLEQTGSKLVIDPGSFTIPLVDYTGITAVVITHEHADHWTPEHLDRIIKDSPDVKLFGPDGVANAAQNFPVTAVHDGDVVVVGPFTLAFYGGKHAIIHSSIPIVDNVGVMVNDTLFYPGDSFTVPPVPVDVLATPVGAPWLKIAEVMDYVTAVAPKRSFPVHEMVLSVAGKTMGNDRIGAMTTAAGGTPFVLQPGESIDL
jgi:L-ascorbate metabolism protein UlaG (beta-lactamase superfamily)